MPPGVPASGLGWLVAVLPAQLVERGTRGLERYREREREIEKEGGT